MSTATEVELGAVAPDSSIVARATLRMATPAALVALKVISIPRRADGNYPEKVGSDTQDLCRLVEFYGQDRLVEELANLSVECRTWLAEVRMHRFSPDRDLNYSMLRVRRYSSNVDADAIAEDNLAALGLFGEWLHPEDRDLGV